MEVVDRIDGTKVWSMEHFDQNESHGNAATKYIIEFTGRVNCDWLWSNLDKSLEEAQQNIKVDLQTSTSDAKATLKHLKAHCSFSPKSKGKR